MDKKEKCNSEKADNIKTTLANAGVIAIVLIILVVLLFALFRKPKEEAVETMAEPYPIEEERYSINSRSLVEFSDVIVEKFREESKLLVSSDDIFLISSSAILAECISQSEIGFSLRYKI